jgi:NADPH:quinone reductase
VSGLVSSIGPGSRWNIGDPVVALLAGGGYATRVVAADNLILPAPSGVSLVDAAGLIEAACTVWSTLDAARLTPGETLLVHGGSGGIGTFAIQYARAIGVRVAATAGGTERTARVAELGATPAIDHRTQDFAANIRRAVPNGVDVVLDVVGAGYLERNLSVLADNGRLAVIGLQQGARAELDLGTLLARRLTVLGTTLRSRPRDEKAAIVAAVGQQVWPLVSSGQIKPIIGERLALDDAARAHRLVAEGAVFGKVLLIP